jgi:hypothetical protein
VLILPAPGRRCVLLQRIRRDNQNRYTYVAPDGSKHSNRRECWKYDGAPTGVGSIPAVPLPTPPTMTSRASDMSANAATVAQGALSAPRATPARLDPGDVDMVEASIDRAGQYENGFWAGVLQRDAWRATCQLGGGEEGMSDAARMDEAARLTFGAKVLAARATVWRAAANGAD